MHPGRGGCVPEGRGEAGEEPAARIRAVAGRLPAPPGRDPEQP